MCSSQHSLGFLALLGSLAPAGFSQDLLYVFEGATEGSEFGLSVASAGDVNADGFDDIVVGAPKDNQAGEESGSVKVFSGADGSLLHTWIGTTEDLFGFSVDGAGDVNNDGFDDIIVGAPESELVGNEGYASVYSGADGSLLYTFPGTALNDEFGYAVSGAGDLNNDGFDDVVVGGWKESTNGAGAGMVRAFSGEDGSALFTLRGDGPGDLFGKSVAGAGDVNNDGFGDIVVGAPESGPGFYGNGYARVFAGPGGAQIHEFVGDAFVDLLGSSVAGAGDVDLDGFDDLIVGIPGADPGPESSGTARVFSGQDGATLFTFGGSQFFGLFGWSVDGAGDVDGNGHADLIVGAPGEGLGGRAHLYSGASGDLLSMLAGGNGGDGYGEDVAGAGDVNGDGKGDFVVGAHGEDTNESNSGSARVYGSSDLGTSYCIATQNSTGASATISASGSPNVASNDLVLHASPVPDQPGLFFYGPNAILAPFGNGFRCVGGMVGRLQIVNGSSHILTHALDIAQPPSAAVTITPGSTWYFQAWYRDPAGGGAAFNLSDGLELVFEP